MEIARGLITELDAPKAKAKAILPDMDDMETDWLPVLQTFTKGAASYAMPRVGQQVYVVFLDDQALEGLIIGGRYSEKSPPPESVALPDCYWSLEDGTKIHLKPDEIIIETPGNLTAKADGDANVAVGANATITVGGAADLTAGGAVTVESGSIAKIKASEITLDASTVKITGALEVANTAKITADATIGGKSFLAHVHTSAQPGTPTSPPN